MNHAMNTLAKVDIQTIRKENQQRQKYEENMSLQIQMMTQQMAELKGQTSLLQQREAQLLQSSREEEAAHAAEKQRLLVQIELNESQISDLS